MRNRISKFTKDTSGEATFQTTMLFCGLALAVGVLAAPFLQITVQRYADARMPGIDQVTTSSIESQKPKRTIIRRSVLSAEPESICDTSTGQTC